MKFKTGFSFYLLILGIFLFSPNADAVIVDQVLAVVNGEIITASDQRAAEFVHPNEKMFTGQSLLQMLIDERLLMAEAKRFEIEPPTEVQRDEALKKLKEKFASEEAFKDAMIHRGITTQFVREAIYRDYIVNRFLDKRINFFVFINPEQVEEYFFNHPDRFADRALDDSLREEIEAEMIRKTAEERRKEFVLRLREKASIRVTDPPSF